MFLAPKTGLITVLPLLILGCRNNSNINTTDLEDRIASLEEQISTQQAEIEVQNNTIAELSNQVSEGSIAISELESELATISETNISDLVAQVNSNTDELTDIEEANYATELWVQAQSYIVDSDLGSMENSIAANVNAITSNSAAIASTTLSVTANTGSIAQNTVNIGVNVQNISNNGLVIGNNQSNITNNSTSLTDHFVLITTNTNDIASNTSNIQSNTSSTASNADNIIIQADLIAANTTTIGSNSTTIGTHETQLSEVSDDILVNTNDIASNQSAISALQDSGGLFGVPALWERSSLNFENDYEQGVSGLLLITNDGSFFISNQLDTGNNNSRAYVTFYVKNPSSGDINIDWIFCRSDEAYVYVDDIQVAATSDGDGNCFQDVSFNLTPGSHKIQITDRDSNNNIEGIGIRNAWIVSNGLEVDYQAMKEATEFSP